MNKLNVDVTIQIVLPGDQLKEVLDFGSLCLTREGRSYIWDCIRSIRTYDFEDNETYIDIDFEEDREVFSEKEGYSYELTMEDIFSND